MCCHNPMGRHYPNEPDTCCHVHAEDLPSNVVLDGAVNSEEYIEPGWTAQEDELINQEEQHGPR